MLLHGWRKIIPSCWSCRSEGSECLALLTSGDLRRAYKRCLPIPVQAVALDDSEPCVVDQLLRKPKIVD